MNYINYKQKWISEKEDKYSHQNMFEVKWNSDTSSSQFVQAWDFVSWKLSGWRVEVDFGKDPNVKEVFIDLNERDENHKGHRRVVS